MELNLESSSFTHQLMLHEKFSTKKKKKTQSKTKGYEAACSKQNGKKKRNKTICQRNKEDSKLERRQLDLLYVIK